MSDVFSTPAEHALSHPELDLIRPEAGPSTNGDALSELSLEEAFEVEDTIRIILDGGYKTVRPSFSSKHPHPHSTLNFWDQRGGS